MSPRKIIFILYFLLSGPLLFPQYIYEETNTLTYNICSNKFCYDLEQTVRYYSYNDKKDTSKTLYFNSYIHAEDWSGVYFTYSATDSFLYKNGLLGEKLIYNPPFLTMDNPIKDEMGILNYDKIKGDTIITFEKTKEQISKEINIYMSHHRAIMFPIKSNIMDTAFCKDKYRVTFGETFMYEYLYDDIIEYQFSCIQIDTSTLSKDYPVFHYKVGGYYQFSDKKYKVYSDEFLYLAFCPQIGFLSYYFPQVDITIALESINGLPISHYVNSNRCITLFCEIK